VACDSIIIDARALKRKLTILGISCAMSNLGFLMGNKRCFSQFVGP
jgi:hypothetical protein